MKKALAVLLMLTTNIAFSQEWLNPEAKFDASKLMTEKTTITWKRVSNVQATCEAESKKRGHGGFGYGVGACAFWERNTCTIITSTRPTTHDLGHEVRHCFQGAFH
jgi:hypothetical protein